MAKEGKAFKDMTLKEKQAELEKGLLDGPYVSRDRRFKIQEVRAKIGVSGGPPGDEEIEIRLFAGTGREAGTLRYAEGALWWKKAGAQKWTHKVPVERFEQAFEGFKA